MALLLSWSASSVTFKGFAAKGTEVAKGIFWGLVKPDMNLLFSASTDGVPYLLMEPVCIAILGTVVGGILALPIRLSGQPEDHAQARRVHLQRADSAHPHAALRRLGADLDSRDRTGRPLRRDCAAEHLLHRA